MMKPRKVFNGDNWNQELDAMREWVHSGGAALVIYNKGNAKGEAYLSKGDAFGDWYYNCKGCYGVEVECPIHGGIE